MGLRGQEKNAEYLKNIYPPHFYRSISEKEMARIKKTIALGPLTTLELPIFTPHVVFVSYTDHLGTFRPYRSLARLLYSNYFLACGLCRHFSGRFSFTGGS